MNKRLVKHEDGWALVIDTPMLELLKWEPETPLEFTTDGRTLVIAPAASPERTEQFATALDETNRRFGEAFKRLAE